MANEKSDYDDENEDSAISLFWLANSLEYLKWKQSI